VTRVLVTAHGSTPLTIDSHFFYSVFNEERLCQLLVDAHDKVMHIDEALTRRRQDGADRDRTDDPRLAKPVLSQLSYSPR
jgi:hypothetical protein